MGIEYLNNKAFETIIDKFRSAPEGTEEFLQAQNELTEAFYLLSKNILRGFRFQLVDKDDAIQDGVMLCLEKLHRFDKNKGKCFAYFSAILINSCKQNYRTAKNYNDLKVRYHVHLSEKTEEEFISAYKSRKKKGYKKQDINND